VGKGKNRVEGMRATGVRGSGGFTMIEIIVVLVFIGLVTGFATMAIRSTDTHSTRSQLAMVKSHLRYAQARAIHSDAAWGINFSGTRSHEGRTYSNYWLFTNGDAGTPVSFSRGGRRPVRGRVQRRLRGDVAPRDQHRRRGGI